MLAIELSFIIVLIVVNGALAMSELAVVSSRPARLKALQDRDVGGAGRALALASDPGKFLSSVQIGITRTGAKADCTAQSGGCCSQSCSGHGMAGVAGRTAGMAARHFRPRRPSHSRAEGAE